MILWIFTDFMACRKLGKVPLLKHLCKWSLIFRCSNVYLPGSSPIAITDTKARAKRPLSDEATCGRQYR